MLSVQISPLNAIGLLGNGWHFDPQTANINFRVNERHSSAKPSAHQCMIVRMRGVESDSVKAARKAKDKLHKACERASEIRERTLHRQKQNRMRMASMRESRDSLLSTQVQSHAVMCEGLALQCLSLTWFLYPTWATSPHVLLFPSLPTLTV